MKHHQSIYLVGHIELASVGGIGDVGYMTVAVGNHLGQVENIVRYIGDTLVQVLGHVAVRIPEVFRTAVTPIVLEIHSTGKGQLGALVGHLLKLVTVTSDGKVVNKTVYIDIIVVHLITSYLEYKTDIGCISLIVVLRSLSTTFFLIDSIIG